MYFPDLSPYTYISIETRSVNVGWLDAEHSFSVVTPDEHLIAKLELYCQHPVHQTFGIHLCDLCKNASGFAEIRVFGRGERTYAAPTLIKHYVAEHHYRPPDEFLQALQEGPVPGTTDYEAFCQWYLKDEEQERAFMSPEAWE